MIISILMSTQEACRWIKNQQIQKVNSVIEAIGHFGSRFILDEDYINELYEVMHAHRRETECRTFSLFLDRKNRGKSKIEITQAEYDLYMKELCELIETEADEVKSILYHGAAFDIEEYKLGIGEGHSLRWILSEDDFYQVMTVFGNGIDDLHEFTEYIKVLYKDLVFDCDLEYSMKKLEAGFIRRRHEILYHLYCINKEIPNILKQYGIMENQALGDKMSIPCSPERNRTTVEKKLTKYADFGKKIKCELHTKMDKIGSEKPDRIYFCADVPKETFINGVRLDGSIYIYKITEHA